VPTRDAQGLLDEDERRLLLPFLTGSPANTGEWRAFCPRCEDPKTSSSPSASFNFKRSIWRCFNCERGGRITVLVRHLIKEEQRADGSVVDIKTRQPISPPADLPTPQNIRNWHKVLLSDRTLRGTMRDRRGLTVDTLKTFSIGYATTKRRYTVPVYDRDGTTLLAVKLYRPTARNPTPKMIFWGEDNSVSLYNAAALDEADDILLTEGEPDLWSAAQNGFAAVSHTAGAGGFQPDWAREFKGKRVFLTPDDDKAGINGAIKTARILEEFAESVYILSLSTGIKKGDLTDYFHKLNKTAYDLRQLMEEAEPISVKHKVHVTPKSGKTVSLVESQSPDHGIEPLELVVTIAGKQSPPYLAPRTALAECDRKKGDKCKVCPMYLHEGKRQLEPPADDSNLLRFVGANDSSKKRILVDLAEALCDTNIVFTLENDWSLEELVAVQSVGHRTEESQQPMNRKVFNVGTYGTPVNSTVRIVGRQLPDPRDSRGIFHSWHLEPVEVDIDKFEMTPERRERLEKFQCGPRQTPLDKAKEIADDLARSVTGIHGRTVLHVAYDLVWHSVLGFDFQGKRVPKGWLEAVAIGDTRTGKSETATALARHYNSGVVKSCEGATFAGLVGGAQPMPQGKGWMITWGTIPLNDRRLVVLDEFSGIKERGIIEQMSSIRSSGVASLQKIVSEETSARTRLLWISNDPHGKFMRETDGMDALSRLVEQPEDIARFDFAMALSNEEVESTLINNEDRLSEKPIYSSEDCTELVMWAWSRKPDQIRFRDSTETQIISEAERLGRKYVSSPPLVQVENIRLKIARIAVAIAVRTFSASKSGELVFVRPAHVVSAVEFLDWVYGNEHMGYLRHSRRSADHAAEAERNKPIVTKYLRRHSAVLDSLRVVGRDKFRLRDFDEFGMLGDVSTGEEPIDPRTLIHQMLQWRMFRRLTGDRGYLLAEPALIEILKKLEDEGL
jgi:MCM P-loop domain